jgi:predicted dienelactone hydrolase
VSVTIAASTLAGGGQDAAGRFDLPAPTGAYKVGTTAWQLTDDRRTETFADGNQPRQVEVLAWYPADAAANGPRASYLRAGLAEVQGFAAQLGPSKNAFDGLAQVQTHAFVDVPPAATPGRLPTLVFSAGYTGIPSSHTALLEDLASHGFVVLDVVHPYEQTAATLDGGVVTSFDGAGAFLPGIRAVFGEWAKEDEAMARVSSAGDVDEQRRLVRTYLAGLEQTTASLRRWVDDTRLVVDRLASLPPGSAAGRLAARVDERRLGVFGHSMGGVTAAQFCVDDRRCVAGLNLDGIPQYGSMIDARMDRPFLMVYSARPGRLGASDAIYRRSAKPYLRIDVADTRHLDFTDMVFWGGPLRARPILGGIEAGRVTEMTRAIVRVYFDRQLRGSATALEAGLAKFPEVSIKRVPRI